MKGKVDEREANHSTPTQSSIQPERRLTNIRSDDMGSSVTQQKYINVAREIQRIIFKAEQCEELETKY